MATTTRPRLFRETCTKCERPALTWDSKGRPRCKDHADRFRPEERIAETPLDE